MANKIQYNFDKYRKGFTKSPKRLLLLVRAQLARLLNVRVGGGNAQGELLDIARVRLVRQFYHFKNYLNKYLIYKTTCMQRHPYIGHLVWGLILKVGK